MAPSTWKTIAAICDLTIAFCFVIMPAAIFSLFHRKRIGHVLNGWFNGVIAVFLSVAVYHVLNMGVEYHPNWTVYRTMTNVMVAITSVGATGYLLWRWHYIAKHPMIIITALREAQRVQQEYMRSTYESRQKAG